MVDGGEEFYFLKEFVVVVVVVVVVVEERLWKMTTLAFFFCFVCFEYFPWPSIVLVLLKSWIPKKEKIFLWAAIRHQRNDLRDKRKSPESEGEITTYVSIKEQ